jgi:hypothetical protein
MSYLLTARHVCYAFYKLGLWTKKQSEAFNEQQWQTDKDIGAKAKVREAIKVLQGEGYEVNVKP